ncbi:329_t:CDS:2 [Entrophospora sp. SA101]|nr:329_t:CDS:2 [Entrophospora sp. SA101]
MTTTASEFSDSLLADFTKLLVDANDYDVLIKVGGGKISLEKLDPIFTLDILTAANELILQELEASVISFFTRHHVNWIKNHPLQLLFHTVFKLESCHKIQQLCLDNICNDPDIVFNSSISKSINESILLQLLKRDDLRMNEIKLLDYLIQWGVTNLDINCNDGNVVDSVSNWTQNEFDALDSILKNCIGNIRFENINRNEVQNLLAQENNNNPKISRIIPKNSKMAIFCADIRGPCFGGNDLCMSNMNNLNKDCTSNLTYYDSDVIKSNKFDVLDYEVFQVVRKKETTKLING